MLQQSSNSPITSWKIVIFNLEKSSKSPGKMRMKKCGNPYPGGGGHFHNKVIGMLVVFFGV